MTDTKIAKRLAVTFDGPTTTSALYMPEYQIPVFRKHLELRWGPVNSRSVKVSRVVPDGVSDVIVDDPQFELERVRRVHSPVAFAKVYPTDESFFEALEESIGVSMETNEREPLEIEAITGIGPRTADEIQELLGDGTLATLALAEHHEIAGARQVTVKEAKRFIKEAQAKIEEAKADIVEIPDPDEE